MILSKDKDNKLISLLFHDTDDLLNEESKGRLETERGGGEACARSSDASSGVSCSVLAQHSGALFSVGAMLDRMIEKHRIEAVKSVRWEDIVWMTDTDTLMYEMTAAGQKLA